MVEPCYIRVLLASVIHTAILLPVHEIDMPTAK